MILVTGAAGKSGRALLGRLVDAGVSARAFVRDSRQGESLRALGVHEAMVGDLLDPAALRVAAQGCRAVYHLCPNVHPEEVEIGRCVIQAALASSVEHFVFHSVLHPQVRAMPHHWNKLGVEELLIESGLPFTVLQPAAYLQNLLAQWPEIVEEGSFRRPYAVEARVAMVDLQDVAEVGCRVLTEPGHEGAIYELCGSELLDGAEIASVLSQELGREVTASAQPRAAWAAEAKRRGLSSYSVETLLAMFGHYECHGMVGNARVLEGLLGRPSVGLRAFARRYQELEPRRQRGRREVD